MLNSGKLQEKQSWIILVLFYLTNKDFCNGIANCGNSTNTTTYTHEMKTECENWTVGYTLTHYDLVNLSRRSLEMFCQNIFETGLGMLYMVGKNFLYRIHLNIVYNESGHKNMNNFDYLFFTEFMKQCHPFKNRDREVWTSSVLSYTHISIK